MTSCLHICCNYSLTTLYKNLFEEIDALSVRQHVYNPVRSAEFLDAHKPYFNTPGSGIYYRLILGLYDRLNYSAKIKKLNRDIPVTIPLKEINIIHAHTWFSDGGSAYYLNRTYNIPYIVTIRNTDLNVFFRYLRHLRKFGIDILENADKIVFITSVYHERLFKAIDVDPDTRERLLAKSVIIPNGIDDFWLQNIAIKNETVHRPVRLLYIGNFTRNKNVPRLIKAFDLLNLIDNKYHLTIVGAGGRHSRRIQKMTLGKTNITCLGRITDKERLKTIFDDHDIFTMPSKTETFGLVYLEALSQGMPVIYTKNEGIYGMVNESAGEAVDCNDVNDIAAKIEKIAGDYEHYKYNFFENAPSFTWKHIAIKYKNIYDEIIV